ncbi:MAG TPA: hypothetical protein VN033_12805 [Vulgatibacter sp.]|nr:hypothetical protein [Vulgatibacter sp.]
MATKKKKNPLFGAAVLKRSFQLRGEDGGPGFQFVYEGVLRDLGVTDEEVDKYLEDHRAEIEAAVRGKR